MALAISNSTADDRGRELVQHGSTAFPVGCYDSDLSIDEVPWHWHGELEAAIVAEGAVAVAIGKERYAIGPGEGFFVNSGVLHRVWDANISHCRLHSLVFHPRLVGGSLDSVFYQDYVLPLCENHALDGIVLSGREPWQQQALEAIEAAWQSCVQEPDCFEFRVRGELSRLIGLIHGQQPPSHSFKASKANREGERIKTMLQYVHDHFDTQLDVGQIAQSAAVSKTECMRCFRSTVGISPIQYVKQYRIQKAARMLSATDHQIADIAADCGFQDISYFTKTFREVKDCTPSEYRSRHS